MKKVAIIGQELWGATAAYYLSKESDLEVTVFDHGQGQATKGCSGNNQSLVSKRRNKAWYKMARLGADFYVDLLADLEKSGQEIDFYQRSGSLSLEKDESKLEEFYELALQRREESPLIGQLAILNQASADELFPGLQGFNRLLYASGGASRWSTLGDSFARSQSRQAGQRKSESDTFSIRLSGWHRGV